MSKHYVAPDEGRHYPMIDGDHIAKTAVPGMFEVFEVVAPAAPMAPPHVSPWGGVLYLLDGEVTAYVDGETYDVVPGGIVVFPAGTPATFEVRGEQARFLAITSGDRAGRFFQDFSTTVPTDRPVEESMGEIMSVTQRHGVALVEA